MKENQLGQTGYEAYALFTGGKTYDGRIMPRWDELGIKIQGAWNAAAESIVNAWDCNKEEACTHE